MNAVPAQGIFGEVGKRVTITDVRRAVAERFTVSETDLVSARRLNGVSHPRQLAFLLARELTPRSLPEIGRMFGNRDHTTVMHGIRRASERVATDPDWSEHYRVLKARLA